MSPSNACLLCRARKVRCDRVAGGISTCSTCARLDRLCVAPKWTPEITWPSHPVVGAVGDCMRSVDPASRGRHLFSEVDRAREVSLLLAATCDSSLDQLLSQLDVEVELTEAEVTSCAGPFGVFRLGHCRDDDTPSSGTQDCENASINPWWDDFFLSDFSVDKSFPGLEVGFLGGLDDHRGLYDNGVDISLLSPMLDGDTLGLFTTPRQPYLPSEVESRLVVPPCAPPPQHQRFLSIQYATDLTDVDVPSIRLLLARYQENLVPAFAPVKALTKPLWERVHIPRVHETLGEILVKGDAGDAKCALLFAILSAASYYLDTVGGGPPHHSLTPWKDMGRMFQQRAKARLVSSLRTLDITRTKHNYKDMLLAILSMVTVCVVSGDMVESHAYLRNAEQFIEAFRSPQLMKSTSIRMLHSTFLYLSTLEASVRVFSAAGQTSQRPLATNQLGDNTDPKTHCDIWEQLLPPVVEVDDNDCDDSPTSQSSTVSIFEQVYSFSETLFRLIGRVTSLASEAGMHAGLVKNPLQTSNEIAEVEDAICSWSNDCVAQESDPTISSPTRNRGDVRHHFQNAIHSALLIYFYKCVRVIDTFVVQPHVEKTVLHLQLYTEAKRQSGDHSSSICWPGFVAGCEALDQDLRQELSQWFLDETAQSGIQMFTKAGTAVKQVWDARDQSNNRNLPWSRILQNDNILDQLVLS